MEKFVGQLAAGLPQELGIKLFYGGILVSFAVLFLPVQFV
jgi:hypothetical protein